MSVEIRQGVPTVVEVSGEIDISNVNELRSALDDVIKTSPNGLVIDLAQTDYIDSAGIAALMSAYQRLRGHGVLALVVSNENIKSILSLVHLEKLPGVAVTEDRESAERAVVHPE